MPPRECRNHQKTITLHTTILPTVKSRGCSSRAPDRLTADSTASGKEESELSNGDLYEFEVTSGGGEPLAGKLTDLTVDANRG